MCTAQYKRASCPEIKRGRRRKCSPDPVQTGDVVRANMAWAIGATVKSTLQ